LTRDEAARRFETALDLRPLGSETVSLLDALGRVLSKHIIAEVDVPAFDRFNVDGFAVRSSDVQGADEEHARTLQLTEREMRGLRQSPFAPRKSALSRSERRLSDATPHS